MKRLILVIFIVILFSPNSLADEPEQIMEPSRVIESQLEKFDLSQLDREVSRLNREVEGYLPQFSSRDIIGLFSRDGFYEKILEVAQGILRYFFDEVIANTKLLGQLIVLAMIVAILKTFQGNFADGGVSKLANGVVYLVLAILALNSFKVAVSIGEGAINDMVSIMQAILPLLLSLLVSMGSITSAALFHPISFLIVNFLSVTVRNLVFPLIFLATILDIVNNISDDFKVTGLAGLFKEWSLGLLGVVLTIFMATIVTQGAIATVSDGVTIRTAKYLTGSFIPIVGGYLSGALEMIVGGSLLIKNAFGVFSVLIILLFCSFSVVKIFALVFIYRLAAAIIQPIGDQKIVNCLNKLANNLLLIFAAVAAVGLMFFVVIIIMVGAANFAVMMR